MESPRWLSLNAIAATVLANIDVAVAALQDILIMPSITQLTPESSPGCTIEDALESSRMFALVVLLKFIENRFDELAPFDRSKIGCISQYNLLGTLSNAIGVCCCAITFLPGRTTDIAKLGTARTYIAHQKSNYDISLFNVRVTLDR